MLYTATFGKKTTQNIRFVICVRTGYCYGVVSCKASHALRPFSYLLCVPFWVLIIHDSSTRALLEIPAKTPSSEAGTNLTIHFCEFCRKNVCHTSQGSLTCRNILRLETDGFTSLPKEVVLRIFINTLPSAGFEPANLGPVASTITTRPPRTTIYMHS
jgi:hypothetical protein